MVDTDETWWREAEAAAEQCETRLAAARLQARRERKVAVAAKRCREYGQPHAQRSPTKRTRRIAGVARPPSSAQMPATGLPASQRHAVAPLVLVSGGASGADAAWMSTAERNGVRVEVMSFPGHRVSGKPGRLTSVRRLSATELASGDGALARAAAQLGRKPVHGDGFRQRLLRRNVAIVHGCRRLFAIGWLDPRVLASGAPTTAQPLAVRTGSSVGVQGGTGWACQLFANEAMWRARQSRCSDAPQRQRLGLYLFEQSRDAWLECVARVRPTRACTLQRTQSGLALSHRRTHEVEFEWERVAHERLSLAPRRRGPAHDASGSDGGLPSPWRVAVVGTRTLGTRGRAAIEALCRAAAKHAPPDL